MADELEIESRYFEGDDLHVNRLTLDKGEVDIDGKIDSFTYSDVASSGGKSESLLSRLFR